MLNAIDIVNIRYFLKIKMCSKIQCATHLYFKFGKYKRLKQKFIPNIYLHSYGWAGLRRVEWQVTLCDPV